MLWGGVSKKKIRNRRGSIANDKITFYASNTLHPEGASFYTKKAGGTEAENKGKTDAKIQGILREV